MQNTPPRRSTVLWTALLLLACAAAPGAGAQEADEPPPPEPRGLVLNAEGAFAGYTLFAPINSLKVLLLDMQGQVAHSWTTEHGPTGAVYLTDEGHLLRCARLEENPRFHGGGIGGVIQELDWDGNLVWEYRLANEDQTQHHDIEPMPNGNLLLIAWEMRYRDDLIEWGRDPLQSTETGLWPDCVIEIRPTRPRGGEVVWEWHSWDHMIQDFDSSKTNFGSIPEHPELIDINADHRDLPPMTPEQLKVQEELEAQMRALGYVGGDEEEDEDRAADIKAADFMHTNAVDYLPEYDLIALSTPEFNEVWIIDHSTTSEEAAWHSGGRWKKGGDLLYRWGNPRTYGAGEDSDRRLFYQHNVEWLPVGPAGELRLTIFNNGGGRPDGDYSSVIELQLPFDPKQGFLREPGTAFGPAEPVWSYSDKGTFLSPFISGAHRLPNGNTLICSGAQGRIFEVTSSGDVVWDFENTFGGDLAVSPIGGNAPRHALFRATRIALDHPGLSKLAR